MAYKFKVGDIVRFKDPSSPNAGYFTKGLAGLEIKAVLAHDAAMVYESDKSTQWDVNFDELELDIAETTLPPASNEQAIAEVGDKVIDYDGRIETITEVYGNFIRVSNTNTAPWQLGVTWKLLKEATTETSETTTQKENNMTTDIEIKVNGKTISTEAKATKVKSEYKLRPAIIADYYSAAGMLLGTKRFSGKHAESDAKAHLVTMLAAHPNAKVVTYSMGETSRIKHQFENVN